MDLLVYSLSGCLGAPDMGMCCSGVLKHLSRLSTTHIQLNPPRTCLPTAYCLPANFFPMQIAWNSNLAKLQVLFSAFRQLRIADFDNLILCHYSNPSWFHQLWMRVISLDDECLSLVSPTFCATTIASKSMHSIGLTLRSIWLVCSINQTILIYMVTWEVHSQPFY